LSTAQKRTAIIQFYDTHTSPTEQISDNGRFADIISSISPAEIDTVYAWIFNYYNKGLPFPTSGDEYNKMQLIINSYQIFT
jgi:hypothetical protein